MTVPSSPYPESPDWPVSWQASRLTARFVDHQGKPFANQELTLTPHGVDSFTSPSTSSVIIATPRTVTTTSDGRIDVLVPATDDLDINPTGWTYKVQEDFGPKRVYYIEAPVGQTQDLSQIVPSPPSSGVTTMRGEMGPIGPAGQTGVGVPLGGAAGTVLAKLSADDYDTVWLQVAEDGTIEGPSAYDVAVKNGFVGDEALWLLNLKGEQGPPGSAGSQGPKGDKGDPGIPGQNGTSGLQGATGKSAYEHARDLGFTGTIAQWMESLRGPRGIGVPDGGTTGQIVVRTEAGTAWSDYIPGSESNGGLSAYEVAVQNGYSGTEAQWLASLRGPVGPVGATGPKGDTGPAGQTGLTGPQGAIGATGLRGPQGAEGPRGPVGATGPRGIGMSVQAASGQAYTESADARIFSGVDFPPTPFPDNSLFFRKVVEP